MKCDLCWATFDTEDGLRAHVEMEESTVWLAGVSLSDGRHCRANVGIGPEMAVE